MRYQHNTFKAPSWLSNPHIQTLWGSFMRHRPHVAWREERLELPDGDFLDLVWVGKTPNAPIVILLHGLNGSVDSRYAMTLLHAIEQEGLRGVLIQFRGCSKTVNRLPRAYHSGDTGDLAAVVQRIQKQEPLTPLYAVGYSLGGNVLLKWLGETGDKNPLRAAVAVSVPFELDKAADRLNSGFSKVYQWWLVRGLKNFHQRKFKGHPMEKEFKDIDKIKTFWEFDHQVTAPLHGFSSAQDYYTQSSSRQYLQSIGIPTLIIQAKDDPFLPESALPTPAELSACVTFQLSETGGHVGFIEGKFPWGQECWLENHIMEYLKVSLNQL